MADPEQIYSEVLSEEQGKGVSAPVAEARAKAARARAEAGSPHPKEPKWWPGAQPHLEGGGDGAAPEAEAEEVPVEEEQAPAEAPVAPEAPAATEEQQAPQVPQEQTAPPAEPVPVAASAQATAPAAQAAPAAAAAAPEQRPSGVIHGTAAGNRLRPEDEATTEAQFEGQQAMYDRRKLIDELIASGVPAIAAEETGQRRSPMLALMYLLIPIMAIAFLLANNDPAPAEGAEGEGGGQEQTGVELSAANVQFDTDSLSWAADEETPVHFVNEDSAPHNFSIYESEDAQEDLFVGQNVEGGAETTYDVPALEAGEYFFRCDLHPTSMVGTVTVE